MKRLFLSLIMFALLLTALVQGARAQDPIQPPPDIGGGAGNYTLVNKDQVLLGWYDTSTSKFSLLSYISGTQVLEPIPNGLYDLGNHQYNDVTAADLNNDGLAEQIAVWVDNEAIKMRICELEGYQQVTSAPAALNDNGQLHVVIRGYDDGLWHHDSTTWSRTSDSPPVLLSGPAVAATGAGSFDVFAVASDNQVWKQTYNNGSWDSWTIFAVNSTIWPKLEDWRGPTPEQPAPAAVYLNGTLHLFRLGPDNTLYWTTGTYWQNLHGMISTGLGAVVVNNQIWVFSRGVDEALWYIKYNAGSWGNWQRVETTAMVDAEGKPVTIAAAPSAVSPAPGEIEVYVRGSDNRLWRIEYSSGSWSKWDQKPTGTLNTAPAAVIRNTNETRIYLRGKNRNLHYTKYYYDIDTWKWDYYGDEMARLPACTEPATLVSSGVWVPELPTAINYDHENIWVDVETGYFLGDGRPQLALAYQDTNVNARLDVFELGAGFTPRTPTMSHTGDKAEWPPRITVGDIDGDEFDEIAMAYVTLDGAPHNGGIGYSLRFCHLDGAPPLTCDDPVGTNFGPGIDSAEFAGTLQLAAGDFDGDRLPNPATTDEVAVISDWWGTEDKLSLGLHFLTYDSHSGIEQKYQTLHSDEAAETDEPWRTGLAVASGDVDGDGIDEIVRTWFHDCDGSGDPFEWEYGLERRVEVLDNGDIETPAGSYCIDGGRTNYTYKDRLAAGDLDRDLKDEILFYGRRDDGPDGTGTTGDYLEALKYVSYSPVINSLGVSGYLGNTNIRSPSLVAAPLTGESLRVGPPTYRVQNDIGGIIAIINTPPKHYDILDGEIYEFPDSESTYATFSRSSTEETGVGTTATRNWALDSSIGTTIGNEEGTHVSVSMGNTYGENFEKTEDEYTTTTLSQMSQVVTDDALYYTGTDYDIWEYPVYTDSTASSASYISVVFPRTAESKTSGWGNACGSWYLPRHQLNNVWSYPSDEDEFLDFKEKIDSENISLGGGTNEQCLSWEVGTTVMTTTQENLGFSAGIEAQTGGDKIPLIGYNIPFKIKASVEGSYDESDLSVLTLTTSDTTEVCSKFGDLGNDRGYSVTPFLYWAKGGYLVLDYLTFPNSGTTFWSKYNQPDPAFMLPWADGACTERAEFTYDITIEPPVVKPGETVVISATVHNFSDEPVSGVNVAFYQGDPDNGGVLIDESASINLSGRGTSSATANWKATGTGEQRIYAVIDPDNTITEMHDETTNSELNNNKGFGLVKVGAAAYIDMGLAAEQTYLPLSFEMNDTLVASVYMPLGNLDNIPRFELRAALDGLGPVVGTPLELLVYQGGEADDPAPGAWQNPQENYQLQPNDNDPPAVFLLSYADGDISGMDENNLRLYWLGPSGWEEATCDGYEIQRFPADNLIAVPVCHASIFAFSDQTPPLPQSNIEPHYLPIILKND